MTGGDLLFSEKIYFRDITYSRHNTLSMVGIPPSLKLHNDDDYVKSNRDEIRYACNVFDLNGVFNTKNMIICIWFWMINDNDYGVNDCAQATFSLVIWKGFPIQNSIILVTGKQRERRSYQRVCILYNDIYIFKKWNLNILKKKFVKKL